MKKLQLIIKSALDKIDKIELDSISKVSDIINKLKQDLLIKKVSLF